MGEAGLSRISEGRSTMPRQSRRPTRIGPTAYGTAGNLSTVRTAVTSSARRATGTEGRGSRPRRHQ